MAIENCKVYSDGNHYIAIPPKPGKSGLRYRPPEELITVTEDGTAGAKGGESTAPEKTASKARRMTRKEYFEELYEATVGKRGKERKTLIRQQMQPYFRSEEEAVLYVEAQFERKNRNMACRRTRLSRKANLAQFNYFCTFTYDGKLHTEESFKKKLRTCLRHLTERRGWKYAGVWERSPEKQRLHFHGLFQIPEGGMVGQLIEVKDYSVAQKKVQLTVQNTYFNKRFGRSDFEYLGAPDLVRHCMAYLTKYMEKTGERIVYSKGLPMYFVSDILDNDVLCTVGQEERKLVLNDRFSCFRDGVYMGTVSLEVIDQMEKRNG